MSAFSNRLIPNTCLCILQVSRLCRRQVLLPQDLVGLPNSSVPPQALSYQGCPVPSGMQRPPCKLRLAPPAVPLILVSRPAHLVRKGPLPPQVSHPPPLLAPLVLCHMASLLGPP
jgi:hypothetical protein